MLTHAELNDKPQAKAHANVYIHKITGSHSHLWDYAYTIIVFRASLGMISQSQCIFKCYFAVLTLFHGLLGP